MNQRQMLLNHMKEHGKITKLEALNKYGVMNTGERIRELRNEGHFIKTIMVQGTKPNGKDCEYAEYCLVEDEQQVMFEPEHEGPYSR